MKLNKLKSVISTVLAAGSLAIAGTTNAALLEIVGSSTITTPSNNDVLGSGVELVDNALLKTTVDNVVLTYYFLGSESGFDNTLNVSGFFSHTEPANGTQTYPSAFPGDVLVSVLDFDEGVVDMDFTSSGFPDTLEIGGGDFDKSIAFTYIDKDGNESDIATDYVLFALDDGGATPDDDNHDDYVGYIIATELGGGPTPVPLPAAAWLFGSAIIGAGIVGRRKKKTA